MAHVARMTCHFDTRTSAMLAERSDNERVLWAIPRGKVFASNGLEMDFDAPEDDPANRRLTWETATATLSEWISLTRPPVLVDHDTGRGEEGRMRRLVPLTKSQAAEYGIEQPTEEAAYVSAELVGSMLAEYDEGKRQTMSPFPHFNYRDSTGRVWPVVFREISFAADQRMKPQHARNLTSARLSEGAATDEEAMPPELEARLAAIEQAGTDMAAKLAALETAVSALATTEAVDDAEEADGGGATMSEAATVEALRAENATLRGQVRKAEAAAFVSATLAERDLDATLSAKLHELYVESPEAAKAAASFAPKRGAAAPAAAAAPDFRAKKTGPAASVGVKLSEGGEAPTTKAAIRAAAAAAGMSTVDYLKATSQTATN